MRTVHIQMSRNPEFISVRPRPDGLIMVHLHLDGRYTGFAICENTVPRRSILGAKLVTSVDAPPVSVYAPFDRIPRGRPAVPTVWH